MQPMLGSTRQGNEPASGATVSTASPVQQQPRGENLPDAERKDLAEELPDFKMPSLEGLSKSKKAAVKRQFRLARRDEAIRRGIIQGDVKERKRKRDDEGATETEQDLSSTAGAQDLDAQMVDSEVVEEDPAPAPEGNPQVVEEDEDLYGLTDDEKEKEKEGEEGAGGYFLHPSLSYFGDAAEDAASGGGSPVGSQAGEGGFLPETNEIFGQAMKEVFGEEAARRAK